jgi:hypothetical protein
MSDTPPVGTRIERLVDHLFDRAHEAESAAEVTAWLASSGRFRAFAEAHRDKIRKKLRTATDAEARRDVRAELRVAQLLLADRRIELTFEGYGSGRGGPDFTVAFRGHRSFDLEVTRMRRDPTEATTDGGPLLAKLRQLAPGVPNVLLVAIEGERADAFDIPEAVRGLRARADAKEEAFFTRRGFEGTRGFYERFLRLGAAIAWCEALAGGAGGTALWMNPSARTPPAERAIRAAVECLRAS